MSAKLMGQVWDLDLPHHEQSVLLALADHADHTGGNAHPGVELLAWKTGYSERQMQRILHTLEASRLIVRSGNTGGGRGRVGVYDIHLENGRYKPAYAGADARRDDVGATSLKGDMAMSPFVELKGDISSTSASERVTFEALMNFADEDRQSHTLEGVR